jgi:hypothetical protein
MASTSCSNAGDCTRADTDYCDDFQQHVDREACQGLADSIDLDTALKNHNDHYETVVSDGPVPS